MSSKTFINEMKFRLKCEDSSQLGVGQVFFLKNILAENILYWSLCILASSKTDSNLIGEKIVKTKFIKQ